MRSTVQHDDLSYLGPRLDGRKRCSHAAVCDLYAPVVEAETTVRSPKRLAPTPRGSGSAQA
jgi:hypothetical protein